MKQLVLDVTAEDIALGIPGSGWDCPIAQCLKRQGYSNVGVSRLEIIFDTPDGKLCQDKHLSEKMKNFITRVDIRRVVKPTKFRIKPTCFGGFAV